MIADPKSSDVLLVFVFFAIISSSNALVATPYPKAISVSFSFFLFSFQLNFFPNMNLIDLVLRFLYRI